MWEKPFLFTTASFFRDKWLSSMFEMKIRVTFIEYDAQLITEVFFSQKMTIYFLY